MFNLENAIQNWKRQLRSNPAFEDGDIAELESHLRDEIDRRQEEGFTDEQAFEQATENIGTPQLLGHELYKSRATQMAGPDPPWKASSGLTSLIPNYIKVAFRTYKRNPVYSAINILSLSIALAVCLLVITFAKDQADYDAFHTHSDRIYRIITIMSPDGGNSVEHYASSPHQLATILKNELPEVEKVSRLIPFSGAAVYEEKRLKVSGFRTDSAFFSLFDYELAIGNAETALDQPNTIVISRETADRFFGNGINPMGKLLTLNDGQSYEVRGVLAARTYRSHLEFDVLLSTGGSSSMMMPLSSIDDWQNPSWYTYILIDQKGNTVNLESKLQQIVASNYPGEVPAEYRLRLQKLTEINLGERLSRQIGRIAPPEFVYFLSALALIVLLAACINYINLRVARSMKRADEIGLRKVIGAGRMQLIGQFISESVVTALVSLILALLMFWGWLLPLWNSLRLATADFGRIAFDTSSNPELYLLFFAFTLLVGLGTGIYPALKLTAYSPARALKGNTHTPGEAGWALRKVLIVLQVALSFVLLISTFLLYQQSQLLLKTDYGFSHQQMINVDLNDVSYRDFREQLLNQSGVAGVSATSVLPAVEFPVKEWVHRQGVTDSLRVAEYSVDSSFLENFDIALVSGRNFSREIATDTAGSVLINKSAVMRLGFSSSADALGSHLTMGSAQSVYQIIGVVEDFQFDFLWNPISPLLLRNDPEDFNTVSISLQGESHESILSSLEKIWQKYEPFAPFAYQYYSEQIENVYSDFEELVGIIAFLSLLAILIAGFGLLAMAHYDTQTRIKEIGVRKVLGARIGGLVWMLSYHFLKMVGLALAIGVPLAIYFNRLWLQIFSTKVHFGIDVILFAMLLTTALSVAAVGFETYKAAVTNPVRTLSSE